MNKTSARAKRPKMQKRETNRSRNNCHSEIVAAEGESWRERSINENDNGQMRLDASGVCDVQDGCVNENVT